MSDSSYHQQAAAAPGFGSAEAAAPSGTDTTAGAASPAESALPGGPPHSGGRMWTPRRTRKIPPKLYRIGEVVAYSGVSRQTIHNYTTMGLLCESQWTPGGHRLYDESVFERLDVIAEMKDHRCSLQDIREHFARLDSNQ